jgi:alkylated DNA repair dioxygenase AlkB/glutathione S-transferase
VIEASSDRDSPEPVDAEAFLSGESATCCAAQSAGFQFPAPILAAIDPERDTVLDKTGYSALESEGLVLSFRQRFVTELYLCGSLSNVSVYATALDAVRNGFAVTLIEDCLGYRDFQRHREAMRRMADILGATGITAQELAQELDWDETDAIASGDAPPPQRSAVSAGIESIIDSLGMRADDSIAEETPDQEDWSLTELVSETRAQRAAAAAARAPADGKKHVRARVRRPKRREPTPDPGLSNGGIGEGDSRLIPDVDLPTDAFQRIRAEVSWQKMYHLSGQVPRLVAVQGRPQPSGAVPIYRHPADESPPLVPFTSAVDEVRLAVERILGHPLNHVLIQLYRDGQDSISEHSDKTLDIVRGSFICNVSLGAQRVMVLRTKSSACEPKEGAESGRATQRVILPHRSLFVLGEKTNMRWLHGIRPDKRPDSNKLPEELAFGGERISLTFRNIGTFIDPVSNTIWGQGGVGKTPDMARPVVHGDPAEIERLIRSFGQENRASEFDWEAVYGGGFDVVNFVTASPARLALSGDRVADLRVLLALGENGIRYEIVENHQMDAHDENLTRRPLYVDPQGTTVAGDLAILTHLVERPVETTRPGVDVLRGGNHLPWIERLLAHWREHRSVHNSVLETELDHCERTLGDQHYLSGAILSIDDCLLWPVLGEIVQTQGALDARFVNLNQYYQRVEKRSIVRTILDSR